MPLAMFTSKVMGVDHGTDEEQQKRAELTRGFKVFLFLQKLFFRLSTLVIGTRKRVKTLNLDFEICFNSFLTSK